MNVPVIKSISISIGFISLIASLSVVLTPIIFRKFRSFYFLHIIAVMSLCDAVTAIAFILNLEKGNELINSRACQIQGFLYTFSINASMSWTVALSTQLYTIYKYNRPSLSVLQMHFLFWGAPLIFQIFPWLCGDTYGMDDHIPMLSVFSCNMRTGFPGSDNGNNAFYASFYGFKILVFLILFVLYKLTKRVIDLTNIPELSEVVKIMRLYPMVLFLLWFPEIICFIIWSDYDLTFHNKVFYAFLVSQISSSLYGIATFLIYFYSSKQARHSWYILLKEFSTQATPLQLEELVYRQTNMSFMSDESSIIITDNDILLKLSEVSTPRACHLH